MADVIFIVLLIIHVGTIVAWLGGAILFSSVIGPAIQKMAPSSRSEFMISVLPRYTNFVAASAVTAIVAGVLLFGYITQYATSLAPSGAGLILLEAGAILGLIAFIIALGVAFPAARRLEAVLKKMRSASQASTQTPTQSAPDPAGAGSPNPSAGEVMRLSGRLKVGAASTAGVLALTLILMIIGASV